MILKIRKDGKNWILFFIVILGAALRISSVFNGLPHFIQIDEGIVNNIILNLGISDLNPHDFIYPGLIYYLLLPIFIFFKAVFLIRVTDILNLDAFFAYVLIGRAVIALFGIFNIVIIYFIGKKLFDSRAGLIAALFLAVDPMNVAWSFIFKPDTLMISLVLLSFLFICRLYGAAKIRKTDYVLTGLFIGLAAAAKYNAVLIIAPFIWAHFLNLKDKECFINKNFLLALSFACLAFFIFNPFIILDFVNFFRNIQGELNTANMGFKLNPLADRRGWINYPLVLASVLGGGVIILSICGFILSARRHSKKDILILSFPLIYYIVMGKFKNSQAHYILPAIPFILLLAAQFLKTLIESVRRIKMPEKIRRGIIFLFFLGFILPTLYNSIYYIRWINQKDTRVPAVEWIRNNVSPGGRLLIDGIGGGRTFITAPPGIYCHIEAIDWYKKMDYKEFFDKNDFDFIIINYIENRPEDVRLLYDLIDRRFSLVKEFKPLIPRTAFPFMYNSLYHPVIRIYDGRKKSIP